MVELLDQPLSSLSLGQRRRACLGAAFTGSPDILLLDEPSNGLPADDALALGHRLGSSEATVLVASHDQAFLDAFGAPHAVLRDGLLHRS